MDDRHRIRAAIRLITEAQQTLATLKTDPAREDELLETIAVVVAKLNVAYGLIAED